MFIQVSDEMYVNLAQVAYVRKVSDSTEGDSYLFYSANKEHLAQTDWGSRYNDSIANELSKR